MANQSICKIDGCDKPVKAHGCCNAHYLRWRRYGDPLKGRIPHGEAARFYREVVLPYDGDECLIWPYQRDANGYARMRSAVVSRRLCEDVNGPAPTNKHQAAHSCGNGHHGCVAKRHLSWKTASANQMDRVQHGTSNRGGNHGNAKLTQQDVIRIMEMKGKMRQRDIAALFGVSRSNVSAIHRGQSWGWL